jgi:hypothetical protein
MGQEYMTVEQIEKAHPGEWILVDVIKRKGSRIVRGRVVSHGPDKLEVMKASADLPKPFNLAIIFGGHYEITDEEIQWWRAHSIISVD